MTNKGVIARDFKQNRLLYLMILPVLLFVIIFQYAPIYGVIIAFMNFNPAKGIFNSPWVGWKNFIDFFQSVYFTRILTNTIRISVLYYCFSFPAPIILALLLNELRNKRFKSVIQTITYIPYFISLVVICGIVLEFTAKGGIIHDIVILFGGKNMNLMMRPEAFPVIYTSMTVWMTIGWSSIIYLSALSAIDSNLYEAAVIDGAGRWKQLLYITLPGIFPTFIILLLLAIGTFMDVGFERIILLYNPAIYETADVISSFVYRSGLLQQRFSFSAAVDLFNSVINLFMIIVANALSRKVSGQSLW